ncbi:hypothetical protein C479_13818 [Halovivax asiaticus JCM 14624]|uniref:Uncharacterized protein n=1 Tax=Halovivax asiaticus JCM 14624 TaxID=1227490 RepID=M0BBY3_9EURY|nr:hypothetical protein [Halovivax asiaticus]ELZ08421.1 hypothetical protein C479_13818 [Halovivax asiaticus JCM 14624]
MPSASMLRDSTQIVIRRATLDDLDVQLDDRFTVTVVAESDEYYRIIGSPVEIKDVTEFLSTRGVNLR